MNYKGWSTASSFSAWSVTGARGCNCFLKMTLSKSLFGFDQNFDRVPMIEDIGNNNRNNNNNHSGNNDKSINAKCWMTRDNQTPLFRSNDAKANRASKISMLSLLLWKISVKRKSLVVKLVYEISTLEGKGSNPALNTHRESNSGPQLWSFKMTYPQ